MKHCKFEGCKNPIWSGGLCKNHIARKPIKKKTISVVEKMRPLQKRNNQRQARYTLFMVLWKKRGPNSEVSNERIYGEPSSAHFHHILPKNKYPQADLDPENIIIMTMDEHANVESDMYKYEEINRRREELYVKYELI